MDDLIVPSDPKYFGSVCRRISKNSRTTWNRLLSIFHDAQFVQSLSQNAKLPIVANLRCGVWYCQDYVDRCYFKSTDGHQGNWCFSLSRLNLHLLDTVILNGGVIIVDATRKGKLFPDALAKTIPIWIAVMNQVLDMDSRLLLYDGVSPSEFNCIEKRLTQWKNEFLALGLDLTSLKQIVKKPMRPVWISQDSIESGIRIPQETYQHVFYPIVLVSCSSNIRLTPFNQNCVQKYSFDYVPGAADDEESWSMGLKSDIFWKHHKHLISQGPENLEISVQNIVHSNVVSIDPREYGFILKRNKILKYHPSLVHNDAVAWLNCSLWSNSMDSQKCLWIPIPNHKKDKTGLTNHLSRILSYCAETLNKNFTVVIYDQENRDVAFCIVLSLVIAHYHFKDDGTVQYSHKCPNKVTKQSIKKAVANLSSLVHFHSPCRGYLKQIFNFFHNSSLLETKS